MLSAKLPASGTIGTVVRILAPSKNSGHGGPATLVTTTSTSGWRWTS